jgi:alpha-tubulin suppressor-like RCC1 family protein
VAAIAGGGYFCMALKRDGTVVTWGSSTFGQTNTPANLSGVKAIAAGGDHCLALKSNGTVVAWGYDRYGQADVPSDLTNAVAVSAGYYHSLALRADGTLVAWGLDSSGQTNIPPYLHGVTAISAGGYHNLALVAGTYPMRFSGLNYLPGGQVQFTVSGVVGDGYRVVASTNLRDWQTIASITNITGMAEFSDPAATNYSRRFYRLVMP